MAKGQDRNFVSVWFWILSMVVLAIPVVNIVMILIWAFTGDNESRKNYFKAIIVMFFVMVGVTALLIGLGTLPAMIDAAQKLQIQGVHAPAKNQREGRR